MSVSTKKSRASKGSESSKDDGIRQTVPSFHRSHSVKKSDARRLRRLSAPHVESFDYFLDVGLSRGVSDIPSCELDLVDISSPE
eukprot:CAMPEP_0172572410 /NCGR_PEP_ID=MMETSP1067-20121228/135008_1 /TAXON_ID=265564 ORGANISM="Thalassiosira punctigera, Strain Tpunct2005C2" /NCGR_SAMPLE_ID=MMETSP1067 /ASSEMBLY_ACC=CAM_ASM_000444 /LENGTH=83 /DNA_ID=CAMNT_0013364945 /DNA_START=137 /DNA_END=385 /DNA_ORIENTATION=+